jgi:hypothetical protein
MIYLKCAEGSGATVPGAISDGFAIVWPHEITEMGVAADGEDATHSLWHVSNTALNNTVDASDAHMIGINCNTALCETNDLSTHGGEWGWFWCGGVCPVNDVSAFQVTGDAQDMTTQACAVKSTYRLGAGDDSQGWLIGVLVEDGTGRPSFGPVRVASA